jgi:exodeoxyribonuclease VII large subunit
MCSDIVEQGDEIISVGQLNQQAKKLLENQFRGVSVLGEISNMARPSSGHIYFTLKDEDGAIRCAMFRNQNSRLNFEPLDGDQCILKGQVSLYAPRGDYQLIVSSIQPAGAGNLMHQFEELKKKLDAEGLFEQGIKKNIPKQPKHIGIITSESTAAFQDVLTTIQRRAPISQVSLITASVQGDTAPGTLIEALKNALHYNNLNPNNAFDLIIICRGGGSIEDLWAFNNESLAREIFNYPLPIISGVGHEIDFTITDFVSDLRAPTPTAAAELVTEYYFQLSDRLDEWEANLNHHIQSRLVEKNQKILITSQNLKSPLTMLKEQSQSIDNFEIRLSAMMQNIMVNAKQNFQIATGQIHQSSALQKFVKHRDRLNAELKSLSSQIKNLIERKKLLLDSFSSNLKAVSPLAVLDRGYAIVMNEKGHALKSSKDVKVGDTINTRLADGGFSSDVSKKN